MEWNLCCTFTIQAGLTEDDYFSRNLKVHDNECVIVTCVNVTFKGKLIFNVNKWLNQIGERCKLWLLTHNRKSSMSDFFL